MIEKVKKEVSKLLESDKSGHDMNHINRVLSLSLKFAEKENADKKIVALIALLHDVDDYKLFGEENNKNLTNAKKIMEYANVSEQDQETICDALKCIGYSKRLNNLFPKTIEGKVVVDADMCDAIGAVGILRVCQVGSFINRPFFERDIFPTLDLKTNEYTKHNDSSICHFFEKILKLKNLMLTKAGKEEAQLRHGFVVDFLYHFFEEVDAPEWKEYLDNYLKNNN